MGNGAGRRAARGRPRRRWGRAGWNAATDRARGDAAPWLCRGRPGATACPATGPPRAASPRTARPGLISARLPGSIPTLAARLAAAPGGIWRAGVRLSVPHRPVAVEPTRVPVGTWPAGVRRAIPQPPAAAGTLGALVRTWPTGVWLPVPHLSTAVRPAGTRAIRPVSLLSIGTGPVGMMRRPHHKAARQVSPAGRAMTMTMPPRGSQRPARAGRGRARRAPQRP